MFQPATTTHGTLLARIADDADREAWNEFHACYEELIRGFARRQGVTGADGDDIVQEVLLSLTKTMPGFEYNPAKGRFRSYLKTVVVRTIVRWRARLAGNVNNVEIDELSRAATADEATDAIWEEEWRQQHMRRAMRRIESEFNLRDIRCFQDYVMKNEDAAQVAARMNLSLPHVYQIKSRILARLREIVAEQVDDEG